MIQYLVKNQVDRIQCNDTGKRIYETLCNDVIIKEATNLC